MADEEKLGVAGEFDSEAFNKGLERYINALLKAEKATDAVVTHFNRLGASLDKVLGSSAGLDKSAKDIDVFRKSLADVSKALPDVKPLNKFFSDVAKGATVLKPIQSEIRSLASLNRSIVALSQATPVSSAVIDSLRLLEPVVRDLGNVPNFIPVSRSILAISTALEKLATVGEKPVAALDTLTSLGVRLKTIAANSTEIRKVSSAISLVARAMQGLSGIKAIPAGALSSLGAIANTLRAISQVAGVRDAANQISLVARALTRLSGIKSIPTQSIASISAIANVLRAISQIQGVSDAAKTIQTVGLSLTRLSRIQAIPARALASIGAIANALRSISKIPDLGLAVQSISRLTPALTRLSKVPPVPAHVFTNLQSLVKSLGGIGTGGNIQALIGVTNALTQALQRLTQAQGQAIPQMERFRTSFTQGVAIGVGLQAVNMFLRLGDAIRSFASQTLGTVTFFERFQLTLTAVIARQLQAEDATLSQADALRRAEKPAQGYFRVLEQIAIQSIFTPEDIALSFRLATAFGFTSEQALRLTQAIVDFTSFAGLGNDALERISRSLAQVRNRGKLTADNVRELAEAGVPVYDILGKAFGKTTKELLELQEDGAIPAGQAINAIVEYFEQYEGAAERATNTTTGLIGKIKEVRTLAARDVFGEIFKSLNPVLREITDFITSNEFRAGLVVLGQAIGSNLAKSIATLRAAFSSLVSSFNSLSPRSKEFLKTFLLVGVVVVTTIGAIGALSLVIGSLINPFTLITFTITGLVTLWVTSFDRIQDVTQFAITSMGRSFQVLAENVTKFGAGIIRVFSQGIVGSLNILGQALRLMGLYMSGFLKPSSPPKILPHLDTWGTQAAEIYLSGWNKADFDELNKFGQTLATQIRNLVGLGNIDELSAPRRIIGTRQALSQALSDIKTFGSVTEQTLQRIFNATLLNSNLLRTYFDSYAQLTRATDALKQAQDALNDSMKAYDDQLRPLQKRLQEIQDAQENAEEQKQIARLQRIIANRGATDSRRASALLELEQIQVENQIEALEREKDAAQESGTAVVDELQKALDQAKENLAIAEARISEQLEINSLLAEEARIRRQIEEELARQKDPRIVALEKQIEVFTVQQEFLGNLIDLAHQQYILTQKDATAAQKKTAELRIQELLLDNQIKAVEASKLGVDLDPLTLVPIVPADFGIKALADDLGDLFGEFEGRSDVDIETPIKEFDQALKDAKKSIDEFTLSFTTTIDKINLALPPFLRFKDVVGDPRTSSGLTTLGNALKFLALMFTTSRIIALVRTLGAVLAGTASSATVLPAVIALLALAIIENWFGAQDAFLKMGETMVKFGGFLVTEVGGFLVKLGGLFVTHIGSLPLRFILFVQEMTLVAQEMVLGFFKGMLGLLATSVDQVVLAFDKYILQPIKRFFGIQSPSTLMETEVGKPAGEGIILGLVNAIIAGVAGVVTELGNLASAMFSLESIKVFTDKALALGGDIITGIKNGLSAKYDETKTFFEGLLGGLFGAGEKEIESGSPSKRASRDLGEPIGEGVLGGLAKSLAKNELQKILDDAIVIFGQLKDEAVRISGELGLGVVENFTILKIDSLKQVDLLNTGITTKVTTLVTTLNTKFLFLKTEILRNIGLIRTEGGKIIVGFKTDTERSFNDLKRILVAEGSGIIPTITEKVVTFFTDMSAEVNRIVGEMIISLTDQLAGENGLTTQLEILFVAKGAILGESFGNGIAQGITNKLEPIKTATLNVIQQAMQAALLVLSQLQQPTAGTSGLNQVQQSVNSRFGSSSDTAPVNGGTNITKIYNLNVNSTQASRGIIRDFGIMEVMGS